MNRLWWAQEGAPVHRRIIVRGRLNEVFHNCVIALGHETEWPPRSPDLTPCDFFLRGYIKNNDLRNRIITEFSELKKRRQIISKSVKAMRRRAELCI